MSAYRGANRVEETTPRITAWSWSRAKTYSQCPFKLKCSAIDRIKEPESEAQLEGKRVHKLAEDFLLGRIEFPKELAFFKDDYEALRNCGEDLKVEYPITFREDLSETTWFAKDAWLRVRFDAFVWNDDGTAVVIDLKTGKVRKEDLEQCELFALAVFLRYPEIEEVTSELWYTINGSAPSAVHSRKDLGILKAKWFGKAERMMADTEFLPTPNNLCGWCFFRKSNGGPCKFS
jgi:RecB family exonuclease